MDNTETQEVLDTSHRTKTTPPPPPPPPKKKKNKPTTKKQQKGTQHRKLKR